MSRCYWHWIPLCPANSCIPVRRATECSVCPLFDRENLRDVSRHGAADSAVREQQQLLGAKRAITYQHDSWDTSHTCLKTRDDSIASTPNFSWDQERHNGSLPHGCDKRIQRGKEYSEEKEVADKNSLGLFQYRVPGTSGTIFHPMVDHPHNLAILCVFLLGVLWSWGSSEPLLLSPESLPVRIAAVCCGKDWGPGTRIWKFTVYW